MGRYQWNAREHKGILRYAVVTEAQEATGKAILARAKALSDSREFTDSLEVLDEGQGEEPTTSVGTAWPFGHLVEWGSVNNPPQAPLRKAVTSLHLKFKED